MEECPICKRMTAERNHYNGLLVCYNKSCDYQEEDKLFEIINKIEDKNARDAIKIIAKKFNNN